MFSFPLTTVSSTEYTTEATFRLDDCAGGSLNVANPPGKPVYMSIGYGELGQDSWTPDIYVPPGNGVQISRSPAYPLSGVRFKAINAGDNPKVSGTLFGADDVSFAIIATG